jgi:hypothetical protein
LERKLQSLIEIEERERGVSERIVAYYESIMDDINDREYVSARHGLEELRSLVLDDAVASLPSIDRRRSVDLHVIDYLEETLKDRPLGHGTPRRLDSDSLDLARESDPSNPPTSQTRARTENQQQAPGSRSTVHLLGVLSSVSGNEAVVEPLIDIPVQYGSQVLIRRNATPELRMDIAVAEIHEVAPGRLMVVILEVFDSSERPRETDLVYTLSQKS